MGLTNTNFYCYLCDNTEFDTIMPYRAHPDDIIFSNSKIIKCKNCGLLQINKKFTPEAIENYYKNIYAREDLYRFNLNDFPLDNIWAVFRGRALAKLIQEKGLNKKFELSIMDVGCGYGQLLYGFTNYLKNKCYVVGVDYDEKTKQVFDKYNWKFRLGGIDDIYEEYPDKIDILITSHVFEHVIDPNDFLKKCGAMLKDDGVLLWEIPNLNEFNLQCDSRHSPHICLWDINSLREILTRNNFEVLFLQTAGKKYAWLDKQKVVNKIVNKFYTRIFKKNNENTDLSNKENIAFQFDVYGFGRRNLRLIARKKQMLFQNKKTPL